jgi:hypothetical protein
MVAVERGENVNSVANQTSIPLSSNPWLSHWVTELPWLQYISYDRHMKMPHLRYVHADVTRPPELQVFITAHCSSAWIMTDSCWPLSIFCRILNKHDDPAAGPIPVFKAVVIILKNTLFFLISTLVTVVGIEPRTFTITKVYAKPTVWPSVTYRQLVTRRRDNSQQPTPSKFCYLHVTQWAIPYFYL